MSEKWEDITGYDPKDSTKRRPRQPYNHYHNTTFQLDTGETCRINSAFDSVIGMDYIFVVDQEGYTHVLIETHNGLLQGKCIDTRSKVEAEP